MPIDYINCNWKSCVFPDLWEIKHKFILDFSTIHYCKAKQKLTGLNEPRIDMKIRHWRTQGNCPRQVVEEGHTWRQHQRWLTDRWHYLADLIFLNYCAVSCTISGNTNLLQLIQTNNNSLSLDDGHTHTKSEKEMGQCANVYTIPML